MLHTKVDESATGGPLAQLTFVASFEQVRAAISQATRELSALNLPREELHSVQLVLAEALNNVVEHAYAPGERGEITLILRQRRAGLIIEVRDRGRAMPGGRPPAGDNPSDGVEPMNVPEGGFGWFLIREIARDLIYDRRDGENFLIFRMALESLKAPKPAE